MHFGRPLPRVEDGDLLSGRARFLDDLDEARSALRLAVVRSPFAHAEVRLDDVAPPAGVELVLPGDVGHLQWDHLLAGPPPRTALATDRVRFVGEPVLALVAEDATAACDALDLVWPHFEPLAASVTVEEALAPGAPLVYEEMGTNVVWRDESDVDPAAFVRADHVLERTFVDPRVAPGMLEPRGALAVPDGDGVTLHVGHQNPHKLHRELCAAFDLPSEAVRVVVPEMGGAFGARSPMYPEYLLCVHAALRWGRPVGFVERRTENLLVTVHGRGQIQRVALGASRDGTLTALRAEIDADFGAAVDSQRWCVVGTRKMLSGAYRIPRIEWSIRGVMTHTPPTGAFRGAGRPEAAYLIERAVDELARELALDPIEVRRRNFIDPAEFPYETGTGATYDSGDYEAALDAALDRIAPDLVQAAGDSGRQRGLGVACYVELAAGGEEYAEASMDPSGAVVVHTGTLPHGQGHETAWSQLAADELGVEPDGITVVHGDTATVARGGGTYGSRSAALGGSAVRMAARTLADRLRELAAEHLEADPSDIRLEEGRAVVVGTDAGVDLEALVRDHGEAVVATEVFGADGENFPFGTHVCVVEVDRDTGEVEVVAYVEVDDCGRVVNPLIVEGQLHGGTLQGISHALAEAVRFDADGQLLTANLTTYPLPGAGHAPEVEVARTETPSPRNPMGVKGAGEAGVTGARPAVANAVHDALARMGVERPDVQMPFTPAAVWAVLEGGG